MSSVENHLEQAMTFMESNRFDEAESELKRVLATDKGNIGARIGMARLFGATNRMKDCWELTEELMKQSPNNAEVLVLYGLGLNVRGQYADAITPLKQALAINPQHNQALMSLGIALRETGEIDEAEKILRQSAKGNNQPTLALFELAHTLLLKKNDNETIRTLLQLIKVNPYFPRAYTALASIYRRLNRLDDAVKICLQGSTANPNVLPIDLMLKDLYWEQDDKESALKVMNGICDRRGTAEDFLEYGRMAFVANKLDIAEKALIWAGTLAPEMWEPHCVMAELYDSLDQTEAAAQEFDKAIKLNRTSYQPHNSLAMFHVKFNRIDAAIKHLEYACKLAPSEPGPRYNLGLVLAKAERLPEARHALRQALSQTESEDFKRQITQVLGAVEQELSVRQ